MKTLKTYQEILCADMIKECYAYSYMIQNEPSKFIEQILRLEYIAKSFDAAGLTYELMNLPKGSHVKLTYKIEIIENEN